MQHVVPADREVGPVRPTQPARPLRDKSAPAPRLSVVVPCYNEAEGIDELHRRVTLVCRETVGAAYELVLVNDGSGDATWETMLALSQSDSAIVAVNLSRNYGHQTALSAGLSFAAGERVLILDADLQDPPELLPAMMAEMDRGADVVYGQRVEREGETWFKNASASLFYRILARLSDVPIPANTGDFRLLSRPVLEALLAMPEQHRYVRGMIAWAGFHQVAFPYTRQSRTHGVSNYPFRRMLRLALDAITGFSTAPLRLSFYLSFGFLGLAFLLFLYAAYSWIFLNATRGWTSILFVVLFFSSVQLLTLGIMGEYLGRIYIESKRRPLFIVREVAVCEQSVVPGSADRDVVLARDPIQPGHVDDRGHDEDRCQ